MHYMLTALCLLFVVTVQAHNGDQGSDRPIPKCSHLFIAHK